MKFKDKIDNQIYSILINEWDPIGIKNEPEAQDEYLIYLQDIKTILSKKSDSDLIEYLIYIEAERMGMEADKKNIARVVGLLKHLKTRESQTKLKTLL